MEAVRDLDRLRGALPRALRIGTRPIAGDDLHTRMRLEPLRHRHGRALWQEGDGLAALQVDEDRAVGVAFAQRPVIHAQHPGRRGVRLRLPTEQAQERVPADSQVPRVAEAYPGFPAQRHAERDEALGQPQGAARPGSRDGGQAFGEDAARTGTFVAQPCADPQLEGHPILRPGQVCQGAPVVTMDTPRWSGTERTGRTDLGRLHAQGDLRRGVIDLTRLEAQRGRIGQQTGQDRRLGIASRGTVQRWCRGSSRMRPYVPTGLSLIAGWWVIGATPGVSRGRLCCVYSAGPSWLAQCPANYCATRY